MVEVGDSMDLPERDLSFRLRANAGRRMRDGWTQAFFEATGVRLDDATFVDLAETEELLKTFTRQLQEDRERHRVVVPAERVQSLQEVLAGEAFRFADTPAYVFPDVVDCLGAVRVRAGTVMQHSASVRGLLKHDLRLLAASCDGGLCLELDYYASDGAYVRDGVFTLSSWGVLALPR